MVAVVFAIFLAVGSVIQPPYPTQARGCAAGYRDHVFLAAIFGEQQCIFQVVFHSYRHVAGVVEVAADECLFGLFVEVGI